ncbi:MAG: sugar phosphate isomerase/epimerase, partial [Planctomycetaceae bacterium]|nr:sugar phosphate isomerase/epimerase [Planctomycetaceae bacterium]
MANQHEFHQRPRLSISELTTYRWTFDEDVYHYGQMGISALGVWRQKLADFGEDKGRELLADSEMDVSSVFWAGGFTGSDGRNQRESLADAGEAIELAAFLEASCLLLYTGPRGGHTFNHADRLFRSALDELMPIAEHHG